MTTTVDTISVAMVGSGGAGVMTAGEMLLRAAAAHGWYGLMTRSYGPQIRGGEAAAFVRLGTHPVDAPADRFDILLAVDWQNVERFADELPLDGTSLVIGDESTGDPPAALLATGARHVTLDMKGLCKGIAGARPNMLALGAISRLVGMPLDPIEAALARVLKKKGADAIKASVTTVAAGAEAAAELPAVPQLAPPPAGSADRWSITGNQAAGLGALRGGIGFVAAYPITPATEILEWLSPNLPKVGGVLVQAEDELASINMVIGASFGGTPSLTATSGPGLALMIEALGLAVTSEVPVVVVNVMRGGPSTGIPTKSEQGDLNIAVYGLPGDAPHVVTAPLTISDCLFTTQWSVHLAEALQTPAIILSDQTLGQARAVIDKPDGISFKAARETANGKTPVQRYALTDSGVSPMALPGMAGCQYTADGLEHNPRGTPSSAASDHRQQLDKRLKKIVQFDYGDHWAEITGDGEIGVITWGSTTGPVREAVRRLDPEGRKFRVIAVRLLSPAQPARMAAALAGVKRVVVFEQNHSGQFFDHLRKTYELPPEVEPFFRPGPLAIRPGEVEAKLRDWS